MDRARRTSTFARRRVTRRRPWLLFALNAAALVAVLVLIFSLDSSAVSLRPGISAPETIIARHHAAYVDAIATDARRRAVAAAVPTVYKQDSAAQRQMRKQAATFLDTIAPVLQRQVGTAEKFRDIRANVPVGVQSSELQQLADLSPQDFHYVQSLSLSLLSQAAYWNFDQNQIPATVNDLLSTVANRETPQQREATRAILSAFLAPTSVPDFAATVRAQQQATSTIVPVTASISRGDVIVERGEMITPQVMQKLDALGVQSRGTGWQELLAALLYAAAIVAMLFWYLRVTAAPVVINPRLLLLIDASIALSVLGTRLFSSGHILLPFFLPVAALSTFAAGLMAPEVCIAMTLAMALAAGWVVADSFELTLYYFLTGAAGVLAVRHVKRLQQFIFAGFYVMVFGAVIAVAFEFVNRSYDLTSIEEHIAAATFNGFVSCSLALGGFTILSGLFGVTTSLHMMELGQPNQPLFRRLMIQAPGTYNHSLLLATMVERAADEIGANSLAAKVGALYHDVGKSTNAECFVENQLGIANIHDELRPEESARIIRGHVTQGLRLAKQYRLPRVILDAIAEHHGTTVIAYFLHKAREQYPDDDIDPTIYTYPGPKPQSKETALIMLGDGCESAVRASSDHSPARITEIVDHIFQERIKQGQLDECPLTLRDLEYARQTFCSVLNGLYHPRIEYPESREAAARANANRTGPAEVASLENP